MKMKTCAALALTALLAPAAFADAAETTATKDLATTATADAETTATTRPADTNTTAMNTRAQNFSEENFNKRWATEESLYREAGVSEENIAKLREINLTQWKAIGAGEKGNVQEVTRAWRELMTPEQLQKVREIRQRGINSHLSNRGAAASSARGTTVSTTGAN